MTHSASKIDAFTINPLAWVETDFLLFIALLLFLAGIVSYAISHRHYKTANLPIALSGLRIAALQDAQTLQNAVEIDLISKGILQITETRRFPFGYFSRLQTQFTATGLAYPLDDLQRWALAKLVEANSLIWSGTPPLNIRSNQGFYSRQRESLVQSGFLLADNTMFKQKIAAATPFFLPLVLVVLWLVMRGITSNAILAELIVTLIAALFVVSHQIRMTPDAYSQFKQTRAELSDKIGSNLQRKDFVTAFAVLGYSALDGTELERFARYRYKEQCSD